jgi:hypothetical protein
MVMLVYLSKEKKLKYVPIINSHAGMTLTPKQWIQTTTSVFAYDVTGLLQRPGLVKFTLKSPGKSIVDCRNLTFNAKKQVRFKTIDGSYKTIEVEEFMDWLHNMAPDEVIWPFEHIAMELPVAKDVMVTDKPAQDAIDGVFYHKDGQAQILDALFEKDLSKLSSNCSCETCSQGFTRAYFHHLLQHTPLLAQRFLVIHNVFFTQLHGIRA